MKKLIDNANRRNFVIGTASAVVVMPLFKEIDALVNFFNSPSYAEDQVSLCTSKTIFTNMENWVFRSGNDRYFYQIEAVRIKKSSKGPEDSYQDNSISYLEAYEFTYNRSEKFFEADLEQVFSDRIIGSQRFDKSKKEIVKLKFTRDGKIKFTLKNWNNVTRVFVPQCSNGTLYGIDTDGLFWVFNLTPRLIPG